MQNKVPCHYYEQYKTLRFGGIKSKGHDSLRIMMNPELYCKPSHIRNMSQGLKLYTAAQAWAAAYLRMGVTQGFIVIELHVKCLRPWEI